MKRYYTNLMVMVAAVILGALLTASFQIVWSFTNLHVGKTAAPIAISGDNNVYVTWWTNKTGNNEVMFRASNDGGATFAKKINLSNTTTAESVDAQIAASGKNVYVTWWERNQTANV